MDMFGSHAGTSETPPDGFVSVLLVVGVALCLFKPLGFLVALQLFSQCRNPFGGESDVSWSLEALWSDFVKWQVLVRFRDCLSENQNEMQEVHLCVGNSPRHSARTCNSVIFSGATHNAACKLHCCNGKSF